MATPFMLMKTANVLEQLGADYDCPDLQANIGDECRDFDDNIGVIDSDCECDLDD